MKSSSAAVFALAALLLLPLSALAADEPPAPGQAAPNSPGSDAALAAPVNPFLPGEQTISLAAGLHIPTFILPDTGGGVQNLFLGGSATFSYQYFVATGFGIGGSVSGAFNSTIGGLNVFTAPLGVTASYWWSKLPFEFSVLGEAGGYLMRYSVTPSKGMIAPFAKAGGGVYWRATTSWSLGLQAYFWFVPELHYGSSANLDEYSGFVETSVAAVYHL